MKSRYIGLCVALLGAALVGYANSWYTSLGIFLLLWASNIDVKLTLTQFLSVNFKARK